MEAHHSLGLAPFVRKSPIVWMLLTVVLGAVLILTGYVVLQVIGTLLVVLGLFSPLGLTMKSNIQPAEQQAPLVDDDFVEEAFYVNPGLPERRGNKSPRQESTRSSKTSLRTRQPRPGFSVAGRVLAPRAGRMATSGRTRATTDRASSPAFKHAHKVKPTTTDDRDVTQYPHPRSKKSA